MKNTALKIVSRKGLTLIELLITIAVSTILIGVVLLTLKTVLDIYHYVYDEIFLQKVLDETLQVVSDGNFESYGIKDSFEILRAARDSITFVPLWVDEAYSVNKEANKQKFFFERPFKSGASLPIGEVLIKQKKSFHWQQYPIVFFLNEVSGNLKANDYVTFNIEVPLNSKVRFVYQPDAARFPDAAMSIRYQNYGITREYRGKKEKIPKYLIQGVQLKNVQLQYFDNTNTEILPHPSTGVIQAGQIANITAVKLSMQVAKGSLSRTERVFINLRNTFASGAGLILRKGTEINIPDSDNIKSLSLLNIIGVKDKGRIVLKACSEEGQSWKINMELRTDGNAKVIHRYSIEYPAGQIVYSEKIDLPIGQALNFLALGVTGRYDYDTDENVDDVVNLKGKIKLTVLEMDVAGAALFVRP